MNKRINRKNSEEARNIASIEIGSHTARLLIARETASGNLIKPIARRRDYINLAESIDKFSRDKICTEGINRTIKVIEDFVHTAKNYNVGTICAVSTGVMRRAANQKQFLDLIMKRTGINVTVISGEREARLTVKGVAHFYDISGKTTVVFDLGGGTTEFIYSSDEGMAIKSLPLGAVLSTRDFLDEDPPSELQVESLSTYINGVLEENLPRNIYGKRDLNVIGSGGTVTTIGAMIKGIERQEIRPDKLNGLTLKREEIEDLFSQIRCLPLSGREGLPGLDKGRAGVIPAGTLTVINILYFLNVTEMKVSYSDILEGILLSYLQGEEYD